MRVWRKFIIEKVVMTDSGVFMVRFRTMAEKDQAMEGGPIFFDSKPVVMKIWSPDLDLSAESVKICQIGSDLKDCL